MADEDIRQLEKRAKAGDLEAQDRLDRLKARHGQENKVYVVGEVHWQYNDEYHYRDSDGIKPQDGYRDKDRAQKECDKRNVAEARNLYSGIGDFMDPYDTNVDITSLPQDAIERLQLSGRSEDNQEWWGYKFPATATDEDILLFLKAANIDFYEVTEVDLHG
jgi:hypothetical protein